MISSLWRRGVVFDIGLIAFWAVVVGLSLFHSLALLDGQMKDMALARARMLFSIIETTRLWNAGHGGVYAPVDDLTPPNPYIDDPQRDVIVNGRLYTKINPAYMTRQISELVQRDRGVSFRISSLNPLRPANVADPWEARILDELEREGGGERVEMTSYDGQAAFRYMATLKVQPPCLECHAKQGYQVGDIRGGISVSIPAGQVIEEMGPHRRQTIVLHGVGFLLLAGASLAFSQRLRRSWTALAAVQATQERIIAERTAELTAANKELARSNTELETFAYVASHDLQEPLRMMSAYAGMIERRYGDRLDDEGREFIGFMTDGASRMKAMIDDLLAYSRVSRVDPAFAVLPADDALDLALANLAGAITESGAEIQRPAGLPEVRCDLPMLVRLFQNLLGNAIKYRKPGETPRIVVSAQPHPEGWVFTIADNGIGIPEDSRERIFQVFQRLHSRADYPGTGVGLAICRRIVERHGGRIWVEPAEGGGSAFRFTLPSA